MENMRTLLFFLLLGCTLFGAEDQKKQQAEIDRINQRLNRLEQQVNQLQSQLTTVQKTANYIQKVSTWFEQDVPPTTPASTYSPSYSSRPPPLPSDADNPWIIRENPP